MEINVPISNFVHSKIYSHKGKHRGIWYFYKYPSGRQPKWEEEEGADEMLDSIIADESTNSALRISPTEISGQTSRPKVILIPSADLWKLRYVEGQVIEARSANGKPFSAEAIAKTIIDNNLTGRIIVSEKITDPNAIDLDLKAVWYEAVDEEKLPSLFLNELKENADADLMDLDDEYKQICKDKIVEFLTEKVSTGKRVLGLTRTTIKNTISPSINDSVLRRCIRELVYEKKIKRINRSNVDRYLI